MQTSLFPPEPPADLDGLRYAAEVIDGGEEERLVEAFSTLDFQPFAFHGYLGNRRTVSFGSRYDYSRERLEDAEPIPGFLTPLRHRAAAFAGIAPERLQHALVTEYAPGAGIGWHRDKPQFELVIGISLLTPCLLRFRRRAENGWDRRNLPLPPRSAYLLSGPARAIWEHSITPMSELRYSVTFRSRRPD